MKTYVMSKIDTKYKAKAIIEKSNYRKTQMGLK